MEKSLDELRAEPEQSERKDAQYEHRVQRLENRLSYKENRSRKERAHRLITRGAAIESILPQVKGLSEVQFYSLMEEILTQPNNAAAIERRMEGGTRWHSIIFTSHKLDGGAAHPQSEAPLTVPAKNSTANTMVSTEIIPASRE